MPREVQLQSSRPVRSSLVRSRVIIRIEGRHDKSQVWHASACEASQDKHWVQDLQK